MKTEPIQFNGDDMVLKASARTYWQSVKSRTPHVFTVALPILAGAILTSVSALLYSRSHSDYAITLLGLSVGGGVVIGIGMFVYQHVYSSTARITLDSSQLVRTGWFARRRSYSVKDIGKVTRRSIELMGLLTPGFLVESTQGRPLFWVLASRWDRSDVERLWRAMGLTPSGSWDDKVDYYSYSDVPRW